MSFRRQVKYFLFSSPAIAIRRERERERERETAKSEMDNMPHRQLVPRHRPGDNRNALRILQLTDIHQFPTGVTEWYCKGKGKCFVWSCLCPATSKEACVFNVWTVICNGVAKLPMFRNVPVAVFCEKTRPSLFQEEEPDQHTSMGECSKLCHNSTIVQSVTSKSSHRACAECEVCAQRSCLRAEPTCSCMRTVQSYNF